MMKKKTTHFDVRNAHASVGYELSAITRLLLFGRRARATATAAAIHSTTAAVRK